MQNVNDLLAQAQQNQREGNLSLALQQFQQVLLQHPKELSLHIACGNLCVELQRFEEAAGYFRRIVNANKKSNDAKNALCYALQGLGNQAHQAANFALAEACFEEILQHQASNAVYWYNLGNAQRELGKTKAALASFMQSIRLDPQDADAHNNLGNIQRELGQLDQAIASYTRALELNPNLHHALAHLVHQKQHCCDWQQLDAQIQQLRDWVMHEPSAQISPFAFIAMPCTTAQEQKQCASNWANNLFKGMPVTLMDIGLQGSANKLKIGYLSADFRLHPLAFLITELIEKHDRTQFEIVAYSYGADDKTPERKRLVQAFDAFVDIRGLNDVQAAQKIRDDQVHVLVDLTGYTQTSRTGIVAHKPAAIHVNWLGFAGTMGEIGGEIGGKVGGKLNGQPLFDYLIADRTIAPNPADFSEKIVYLPCYQPNDSQRAVSHLSTRASQHLPEGAFVFCCFNQTFKITPEVFAVWMQILKQVPNSVLWLLDCNPWAKANLQREASNAGVKSERLIFAPRVSIAEHLARHAHADLFLDTLPYNAHTTASDALLMGVPVLTCMGNTFASRVAASLLYSVQLPELVTTNHADYREKAVAFAQQPAEMSALKTRLAQHLSKSPAFDTTQFAVVLERQYQQLWQAYCTPK